MRSTLHTMPVTQLPRRGTKTDVFSMASKIFKRVTQWWAGAADRSLPCVTHGFGAHHAFFCDTIPGDSRHLIFGKRTIEQLSLTSFSTRTREEGPANDNFIRNQQAECGREPFSSCVGFRRSQPMCIPRKVGVACLSTVPFSAEKIQEAFRSYNLCPATWKTANPFGMPSARKRDPTHYCGFALQTEGRCKSLKKWGLEYFPPSGYKRLSEETACKGVSLSHFPFDVRKPPSFTIEEEDRAGCRKEVMALFPGSIVAGERIKANYANRFSIPDLSSHKEEEPLSTKDKSRQYFRPFSKKQEVTVDTRRATGNDSANGKSRPNILSLIFPFSGRAIQANELECGEFFCFQDRRAHSIGISPLLRWSSVSLREHPQSTRGAAVHVENSTNDGSGTTGAAQLVNNVAPDYGFETGQDKNAISRRAKGYGTTSTNNSGALGCSDRKRKIMNGTEYIRRKTGHRGRIKRNSQAPAYKRK